MSTRETRKEIQDQLSESIEWRDIDLAKKILLDHPDIAPDEWIGVHEVEDSTLLIDACRYGQYIYNL